MATFVTGLKDRAALQEKFGLASAGKPAPELMMMGRIKPTDGPAGNPEFNAQLVAEKIEAITSPPPAPETSEPDAAASQPAAPQTAAPPAQTVAQPPAPVTPP
ncbi:cellulose synthase, partial [Rhizobium ruizarguesonis]